MKFIIRAFVFLVLVSGAKVHAGELKTSVFQFDYEHVDQQAMSLGFNYSFDNLMKHRIGEVKPLVGAFMTEYYAGMAICRS